MTFYFAYNKLVHIYAMEVKLIELILFQFHPWIKIVKEPPAELGIGLDQGKLNINVIDNKKRVLHHHNSDH